MFSNLKIKISRFINKVPLKKRERKNSSLVDYKFKKDPVVDKNGNIKKGLIFIFIIIFLFILYLITTIVIAIVQYTPREFPNSTPREKVQGIDQRIKTIMILILDRPDESHAFVDGLAVMSYNFDTKRTSIFTINPDLEIFSTRMGKDLFIRTAFNDILPIDRRMSYFTEGVESLLALKIDNYIVTDILTFNNFSKYIAPINISIDQKIVDKDVVNLPDKQFKQWDKGNTILKGDDLLEFLASNNNGRDDQLNRQAILMKKLILNFFNIQNIYNIPEIIESVKKGFFYTDITKDDIFQMVYEISQIKESNIGYGFTKAKAYYSVNTVTFYPVFSLNFSLIDKEIGDVFSDLLIFKEQARIELLNGSSVKGLASNRARWISNTGARIIKVGNSYETEKITKIYCEDISKYPKTISAIQRIFDGKAQVINKDYQQRHVGDIIVVIGDEY